MMIDNSGLDSKLNASVKFSSKFIASSRFDYWKFSCFVASKFHLSSTKKGCWFPEKMIKNTKKNTKNPKKTTMLHRLLYMEYIFRISANLSCVQIN